MQKKLKLNSGFTLIELLVVVAIIGLLSSVVLSNLKAARAKSKDAFLKEQGTQMRILLEQEYNETGSYTGLQPGVWATTSGDCDTMSLTGNFATQTRAICKAIIANTSNPTWTWVGPTKFYLGSQGLLPNKYSILISLPYKDTYFCLGSSGATSDNSNAANLWTQPGCFENP